jgi:hypothetical protein
MDDEERIRSKMAGAKRGKSAGSSRGKKEEGSQQGTEGQKGFGALGLAAAPLSG